MKIKPKKTMHFGTTRLSGGWEYDVVKVRLGRDPGYIVRKRISANRWKRVFVPAHQARRVE